MLFQLASVPLSPRRVLCRSGECRQRISYTKQRWAQLLFFGNVLLVSFDRTSGRTVLQMKHLIERKRKEFMKKSFMIPIIRIKKYGELHETKHGITNAETNFQVLGLEISLTSVQKIKKAFFGTIKGDLWLKNFV